MSDFSQNLPYEDYWKFLWLCDTFTGRTLAACHRNKNNLEAGEPVLGPDLTYLSLGSVGLIV